MSFNTYKLKKYINTAEDNFGSAVPAGDVYISVGVGTETEQLRQAGFNTATKILTSLGEIVPSPWTDLHSIINPETIYNNIFSRSDLSDNWFGVVRGAFPKMVRDNVLSGVGEVWVYYDNPESDYYIVHHVIQYDIGGIHTGSFIDSSSLRNMLGETVEDLGSLQSGSYGPALRDDLNDTAILTDIPLFNSTFTHAGILHLSGRGGLGLYSYGLEVIVNDYAPTSLGQFFTGLTPVSPDPLEPGGTSETGGGDGDFDSDELDLDFPDDPALSAVGTGMVSLFSPTTAQLQALATYLWSTDFDLDLFKKMFAAPLDAILGLSIVPVAVPTSGAVALKFGGWPTTVSMNKTNKQWVTVDCGSVNVNKYWGSALDYNPYTKVSIFLPYIGMRDLDTDEVMGKTITVKYKVDILSGACVAMVKCGGAVLYQFAGSCAVQVPVSNRDWSSVIGAAVSFGAGAIAAAATGGASAVGTAAVALNTASAVMSAKVNVSHTGSVGGSAGFMGIQNPYILIKRARQSRPADYNKIEGYPSNIYETIGNLRGFTQIEKMHLENIPATTNELDELESLMMEGVII